MEFNPLSPEFRADPYPVYEWLRRDAPVHRHELGVTLVSRYDDVVATLKQPNLFSSSAIGMNINGNPTRTGINTDPPVHTWMRNLVNRAFTPRMVADLEPRIREITAELLDRIVERGRTDIIADLAVPLPVTVISELLGVDPDRRDDFKRWSTAVVSEDGATTDEARAPIQREIGEFVEYFRAVIDERRAHRGAGDLISVLVAASEEEHEYRLTADDTLGFTALLLIAGNETTTNLIGNMVLALLDHADQLASLRSDPSLIPNVVEEALRWDSPVQFLFRRATEDAEIAGVSVPAGTTVLPMFGSANRDEARFPDAARFDITRNTQGHIAFGHGVHFCLGAPLARLEARVALEQVLLRLPALRRADDAPLERVMSPFLRGLTRLDLEFEPSRIPAA